MSFFNKKEEVYHIELTPYGRYLLSIGKLKPHHYRFFDDDVVYDSDFISKTETQNETHKRILDETPKLKPNGNLKGVLTNFPTNEGAITLNIGPKLKKLRKQRKSNHIHKMPYPIGSFKNSETSTPSIQVDFFNGEISSSSKVFDYGSGSFVNIPQIDVDVEYIYTIKNPQDVSQNNTNYDKPYHTQTEDGKILEVVPNIPFIRIKSEGTYDEISNYDLQIFKVESGSTGVFYDKLKFSPKFNPIQNGILVESPEEQVFFDGIETSYNTTPSTGSVEYFFDISVDNEIPDEIICETVGDLKIKNIYLDKKVNCPDLDDSEELSPYASKVSVDDLKDC